MKTLFGEEVQNTPRAPIRRGVSVNKKKREDTSTLFPGYLLNQRVRTLQNGACVIGALFERITARVIGGECYTTDSTSSLCPDVAHEQNNIIAESKAFGANKSHRNSRVMMEYKQLDNYQAQSEFKHVHYCLWNYTHPKPVGYKPKNVFIRDVVENVLSTFEQGYILDVSIVQRMRELVGLVPGCCYRHARLYFIGRGVIYREYLIIYRGLLDGLRADPEGALLTLGLDPEDYICTEKHRQVRFVYDGVEFRTKRFRVFQLLRKPEEVPF